MPSRQIAAIRFEGLPRLDFIVRSAPWDLLTIAQNDVWKSETNFTMTSAKRPSSSPRRRHARSAACLVAFGEGPLADTRGSEYPHADTPRGGRRVPTPKHGGAGCVSRGRHHP